MGRYFTAEQISLAGRSFAQAEKMAGRYFHVAPEEWKEYRYDVKTLAYLDKHEVREGAFAHLCKYEYGKEPEPEGSGTPFLPDLPAGRSDPQRHRAGELLHPARRRCCSTSRRTNWSM